MKVTPVIRRNNFERQFTVVDSHTQGEATRIVLEGFPKLVGNTMIEKKHDLQKNYDHYRRALLLEPRGHKDMYGAVITEPVSEEADFGIVFMDSTSFTNMCGHGTIGFATVALETGLIEAREPYTDLVLEAPAGLVHVRIKVEDQRALEVSLENVPCFLYKENLTMTIKGKEIVYDIAFGGQFFGMIDVTQFGLDINPDTVREITKIGIEMQRRINEEVVIQHPTLDITRVDLCEFYGPTTTPGAHMKNVVTIGQYQQDRSPCGTGLSAKLASLYTKGEIGIGEEFIYESFIGSLFKGEITKTVQVGPYEAVIPKITGGANITGVGTYIIDQHDPLKYGFIAGV